MISEIDASGHGGSMFQRIRIFFSFRLLLRLGIALLLPSYSLLSSCGDGIDALSRSEDFTYQILQADVGMKTYITRYDSLERIFYLADGRRYQRRSGGLGSPLPPIILEPNPMALGMKPCWIERDPMHGLLLIVDMSPDRTVAFPVVALRTF